MKVQRRLTAEETKLIQDNVALAKFLFNVWLQKLNRRADYGVDPNELFSEAYYGLVRAALRYRSYGEEHGYSEKSIAEGTGFGVFARKSIIGQMLDYLRKLDHVHALVRNDYKALIAEGLGSTDINLKDAADAANLSVDRAQKVVHMIQSRPVYLDDPASPESEFTVGEVLTETSTVEETARVSAILDGFVAKFDSLQPLEKLVLAGKYFAGMELPEIAKLAGVGLTAIRTAHTEALVAIHTDLVNQLT